jgi:hypothetical protein
MFKEPHGILRMCKQVYKHNITQNKREIWSLYTYVCNYLNVFQNGKEHFYGKDPQTAAGRWLNLCQSTNTDLCYTYIHNSKNYYFTVCNFLFLILLPT